MLPLLFTLQSSSTVQLIVNLTLLGAM